MGEVDEACERRMRHGRGMMGEEGGGVITRSIAAGG
jgi:hypothetical protein